jgi:lysyl-tRNA synthetase class 2
MPRVPLQPVASSTVSAVGYDETTGELFIVYRRTGEIYVYLDVPAAEYERLLNAQSKGAYLNMRIKGHYRFRLDAQS